MTTESHNEQKLQLSLVEVAHAPKSGLDPKTVEYLGAVGGLNQEVIKSMFKSGDLNIDPSSLTKNIRGGETPSDGVQIPTVKGQGPAQDPSNSR